MDGEMRRIYISRDNQINQGEKDDLYSKLWHACAGPSVYVPRAGEKVLYFPQGHIEQVEAYLNEDGAMDMPIYNLPSKILCTVLHVDLKVETGTDDIFAHITLIPETQQNELSIEHTYYELFPQQRYSHFFSKVLTPSDISTHGGFSVPKRYADNGCLPLLDTSQEIPQQELLAMDLHGHRWCFRHVFRGQPKRNLLTSGWSTFVNSKKLAAGDTFIFLRGENEELGVGVRRAMSTLLNNPLPSIISSHSIRHGILANAFHAFSTRTRFTVYYRPWARSSEFITPLDQYLKAAQFSYCLGTRFRMRFESEEYGEQRALGTIIGIDDLDHIRWPNSQWRCLKVKWDLPLCPGLFPERVCPWSIDLKELTKKKKPLNLHQQKRARPNDASSSMFPSMLHGATKNQPQSSSGVFQGQEDSGACTTQSGAPRQSLLHFLPQNPGWASMQQKAHKQLEIQNPSSNKVSVPLRNENETSLSEPIGGDHKYMLFGVNLVNGSPELPSPQVVASSQIQHLCSTPPTSQLSVSEPSKVISSKQCNNCCSVGNRSCTKVLKYGTALGRSIDLYRFNGYEDLICELDGMFDFNGRLTDGTSGWHVTYVDKDGDMMLIGDQYPWQKFQYEVRKLVIRPKEEIERPNPKSPSSASY